MNTKKFKSGDFILLLLYAYDKRPISGRTRLQKTVFLFTKELMKRYKFDKLIKVNMGFSAHRYGPFSKKLLDFIELFRALELIRVDTDKHRVVSDEDDEIFINDLIQTDDVEFIENVEDGIIKKRPVYSLTNKGEEYTRELWELLNNNQRQALNNLKKFCVRKPLKLILKYIYVRYPDVVADSYVKEKILKEMKWKF